MKLHKNLKLISFLIILSLVLITVVLLLVSLKKENVDMNKSDTLSNLVNENIEEYNNKKNLSFVLKSFYFNNPKNPTGEEIKFQLEYADDIPNLIQKDEHTAVIKYDDGLKLLLSFPTEGFPSNYKDLDYIPMSKIIGKKDIFKIKGNNEILSEWSNYLSESQSYIYIYTNNLNKNCHEGEKEKIICSNNQIFLEKNKSIYLVCATGDEKTLEHCDKVVKKLIIIN